MTHPFPLPPHLSPDLARVRDYWQGLLRGGADMPFWDDAKLTDLPDLSERLFLLDVFDQPERFRLNTVPDAFSGASLAGKFIEHADLDWPFEFLRSQASATVECAAPTWFHSAGEGAAHRGAYSRLMLPMWGEGRIGMLLGAVDLE
ncbi:MAG: hypothetical protein P4L73_00125 [Caulobacteraceae bacterium]|nr:hypothetical protein [Caulobacteraceae bacterium]